MAAEVTSVILFVKNMETMLSFYEDVLGLQRLGTSEDEDEFVSLTAGTIQLSLHKIPHRYSKRIEITNPPIERQATPIKVVFQVGNVARMRETLDALGLPIREVRKTQTGCFCDAVDPEGNIFQICDES